MFYLYKVPKIANLIEAENSTAVARGQEKEIMGSCSTGIKFQLHKTNCF